MRFLEMLNIAGFKDQDIENALILIEDRYLRESKERIKAGHNVDSVFNILNQNIKNRINKSRSFKEKQ